ncbi:MAG TPA: hypothetical protein VIQ03_11945 [Gammaproteobacteria bacterium]
MYKLYLLIIFTFFSGSSYSSPVYLSSYSLDSGMTNSWGGGIHSTAFHGIRFSVENQIHLTGLTAYMQGSGNYFGAIAQVDSASGLPTVPLNNVQAESLAYRTGTFDSYTRYDGVVVNTLGDHTLIFDVTLSSGYYVAFFGGFGGFGAEDSGIIPFVDNPSLSLIPISDYVINSSGTWFEAPSEVVRIEILADVISPVPLPPSIILFLSGSLLGLRFIKRKST